jgi:hypothetical protein
MLAWMSFRPGAILVLAGALAGCGSASLQTSDGGAGQGGHAGSAGAGGQGGSAGGGHAGSAGAGGQGGNSGAGGQGGVATAGNGGGGASVGGAAGGGHGDAGVDMGFPCTDTTSDAHNCGACGHSCLGGTCASSICQPFALGTTKIDSIVDNLQLSQGSVYVMAESNITNPQTGSTTPDVWQLDASTPSTPAKIAGAPTPTGDTLGCVMGGALFWAEGNKTPASILTCTLSSCAATAKPIITNINAFVNYGPYCDQAANQFVFVVTDVNGYSNTVYRSAATGVNPQAVTSWQTLKPTGSSSYDWEIAPSTVYYGGTPDRIFYWLDDMTAGKGTLYYISTVAPNTTGVPLVTLPGIFDFYGWVLASDTTAMFMMYPGGNDSGSLETFAVPLPNGVVSGSAPVFNASGGAAGVVDATSFYGIVWGSSAVPADALVKCTLPTCLNPVIIARGQSSASAFTQDATAIYWASTSTTMAGFTVWKVAK